MIEFVAASKVFQPSGSGVKEITFQVEPGEMVVITGRSGSGKTTLLKLLTGEYKLTSGDILFFGDSLAGLKKNKLHLHRRKIGAVYQDGRLINELTVAENVALPLSIVGTKLGEIQNRVLDLLKLVELESLIDLFPIQLSGGELQRVAIARSLALAPQVLFADEPTGNLDEQTSLAVAKLLKKINDLGTTVILSTHDSAVLDLLKSERQIHLSEGKLVKDTRPTKHRKSTRLEEKPETKDETPAPTEVEIEDLEPQPTKKTKGAAHE